MATASAYVLRAKPADTDGVNDGGGATSSHRDYGNCHEFTNRIPLWRAGTRVAEIDDVRANLRPHQRSAVAERPPVHVAASSAFVLKQLWAFLAGIVLSSPVVQQSAASKR